MSERKRAREWNEVQVRDLLRGRILSGIHNGLLDAGDRAPTYREMAEESGLDLRAVARIYASLEREGLVEVRGRQGVFIAPQERIGGRVLQETARWLVGVLRDAWTRQLRLPEFPEFVRECISTVEVSCACVESTEDQLDTICTELRRDFGLRSAAVHADRLVPIQAGTEVVERIPDELRSADMLVTTAFHAAATRSIARSLGKPLVVVRLNPEIVRDLQRCLSAGTLTVICIDPRFLERLRLVVGGEHAERIRGLLVSDRAAIQSLDPRTPVLISHAARSRLGHLDFPDLLHNTPVLARESAEELAEVLVRFNLQAMGEQP